jgi:hypothetical protein
MTRTRVREIAYAITAIGSGLCLTVAAWLHVHGVVDVLKAVIGNSATNPNGNGKAAPDQTDIDSITKAITNLSGPIIDVVLAVAPVVLVASGLMWVLSGRQGGLRLLQGVLIGVGIVGLGGLIVS